MNAIDLCPPPHLTAADLCGKDCVVTMKGKPEFKLVGKEKANKGVIYFAEFNRGLVLNRTNLQRIITLHGNDTDAWEGKQIILYPSETDKDGQIVPCIRVRDKLPSSK